MKTTFALVALAISSLSFASELPVSGADTMNPLYSCRPAVNIADAGTYIAVSSGGFFYHLTADVSEQSFAGLRDVAHFSLVASQEISGTTVLTAKNSEDGAEMKLVIYPFTTGSRQMSAVLKLDGKFGHRVEKLLCANVMPNA